MPKSKSDHVVMQGNEFVCLHCKETYAPTIPCSMIMFSTMAKQFSSEHRECPAPKPHGEKE